MLRLTKRTDYGLIALKHLALDEAGSNSSAKEIADRYRIPLPLMSKVLQTLARSGFVTSEQGTRGGYRLARDPRRINALDVIRAIDGPILLASCFAAHSDCNQSERCTVREPLRKVHDGILRLLESITITDLAGHPAGNASDGIGSAATGNRILQSNRTLRALS
jgi:Rrf2 family protein